MSALAWTARWAVVPYVPAHPFRIYTDRGPREGLTLADVRRLSAGGRSLRFMTDGKLRPVLILADPPPEFPDLTALRLMRLERLSPAEQDAIREHADPWHFHLPPERFNLPKENAAMIPALVRLQKSAVDETASLGKLNIEEQRVLGERIIRFYGFNTDLLVHQRITKLAELRTRQKGD